MYLPTFVIASYDREGDAATLNDRSIWHYNWNMYDETEDKTIKDVESVNCTELVHSWTDISKEERAEIVHEIPSAYSLCPNLTYFVVRMSKNIWETQDYLALEVSPTDKTDSFKGTSAIYVQDIVRYFDPDLYKEKGYQQPIAESPQIYTLFSDRGYLAYKEISRREITFFDFSWLDLSSITLFDFG